jgi:hypothetical protein
MGNGSWVVRSQSAGESECRILLNSFPSIFQTEKLLFKCPHYRELFINFLNQGVWIDEFILILRNSFSYSVSKSLRDLFDSRNPSTTSPALASHVQTLLAIMLNNISDEDLMAITAICAYPYFIQSANLNYWLQDKSSCANLPNAQEIVKEKLYIRSQISGINRYDNDEDDDDDDEGSGKQLNSTNTPILTSSSNSNPTSSTMPYSRGLQPFPLMYSTSSLTLNCGTTPPALPQTAQSTFSKEKITIYRKHSTQIENDLQIVFERKIARFADYFSTLFFNESWTKHLFQAFHALPIAFAVTSIEYPRHLS